VGSDGRGGPGGAKSDDDDICFHIPLKWHRRCVLHALILPVASVPINRREPGGRALLFFNCRVVRMAGPAA
jgi:hypothetical protein